MGDEAAGCLSCCFEADGKDCIESIAAGAIFTPDNRQRQLSTWQSRLAATFFIINFLLTLTDAVFGGISIHDTFQKLEEEQEINNSTASGYLLPNSTIEPFRSGLASIISSRYLTTTESLQQNSTIYDSAVANSSTSSSTSSLDEDGDLSGLTIWVAFYVVFCILYLPFETLMLIYMLFGFRRLVYLCRQYRRHRQAKNQLQDNGKKLNQADDVIPDKAGESGSASLPKPSEAMEPIPETRGDHQSSDSPTLGAEISSIQCQSNSAYESGDNVSKNFNKNYSKHKPAENSCTNNNAQCETSDDSSSSPDTASETSDSEGDIRLHLHQHYKDQMVHNVTQQILSTINSQHPLQIPLVCSSQMPGFPVNPQIGFEVNNMPLFPPHQQNIGRQVYTIHNPTPTVSQQRSPPPMNNNQITAPTVPDMSVLSAVSTESIEHEEADQIENPEDLDLGCFDTNCRCFMKDNNLKEIPIELMLVFESIIVEMMSYGQLVFAHSSIKNRKIFVEGLNTAETSGLLVGTSVVTYILSFGHLFKARNRLKTGVPGWKPKVKFIFRLLEFLLSGIAMTAAIMVMTVASGGRIHMFSGGLFVTIIIWSLISHAATLLLLTERGRAILVCILDALCTKK